MQIIIQALVSAILKAGNWNFQETQETSGNPTGTQLTSTATRLFGSCAGDGGMGAGDFPGEMGDAAPRPHRSGNDERRMKSAVSLEFLFDERLF